MAENAPSWMRRASWVAVQDFEDVEDVLVAAHEAEHLGDVHGVARSRVGEQFAELRALERVEAAGGARVLLEDDRVLDPGLGEYEVLAGGGLLVGRHPLVDEIGHAVPRFCRRIGRTVGVIYPCRQPPSDLIGSEPPSGPGMTEFIGRPAPLSSFDRLPTFDIPAKARANISRLVDAPDSEMLPVISLPPRPSPQGPAPAVRP
jgi:hypothetical protein